MRGGGVGLQLKYLVTRSVFALTASIQLVLTTAFAVVKQNLLLLSPGGHTAVKSTAGDWV